MRKNHFGKKLWRRAVAFVLAAVVMTGAAVAAAAESVSGYYQKAAMYLALGDNEAAVRYFDQEIGKDPENAAAYLGRALIRLRGGDRAGARQDCDYVIGRLPANWTEELEERMWAYVTRASVDFEMGDQAQYLADMQSELDILNKMTQLQLGADEDWNKMLQNLNKEETEITQWYNNGSPAKSFQHEYESLKATVTGGAGDTSLQISEVWDDANPDLRTTCDTTFHLSQPIRKVVRKSSMYGGVYLFAWEEEQGAVGIVVPAGTTITMEQVFQSGRSRAQSYQSFGLKQYSMGDDDWNGTSLTVEAGKSYCIDYDSNDGIAVYFIAE